MTRSHVTFENLAKEVKQLKPQENQAVSPSPKSGFLLSRRLIVFSVGLGLAPVWRSQTRRFHVFDGCRHPSFSTSSQFVEHNSRTKKEKFRESQKMALDINNRMQVAGYTFTFHRGRNKQNKAY
jgi:hypothetical protein